MKLDFLGRETSSPSFSVISRLDHNFEFSIDDWVQQFLYNFYIFSVLGIHDFLIAHNSKITFTSIIHKVSKGAKIRSRYNQVPHLTQDTNGKVTN